MDITSHLPPCLLSIVTVGIFSICATFFYSSKKKLNSNSNNRVRVTSSTPSLNDSTRECSNSLLWFQAFFVAILVLISCAFSYWHLGSLTPFPAECVGGSERRSLQQQQPFHEGHVLITGASQGIGRAITLELAKRYAPSKRFIITSRSSDSINQLSQQLSSLYHANVTVIPNIDLSKPGGAQLLYQTTKEMGLYVDVLVLNAGAGSRGLLVTMDIETIRRMIHLNVESTTILSSLYGQDMKHHLDSLHYSKSNAERQQNGKMAGARIMIISSVVGIVPGVPFAALYAASKSYVRSLSWGLAAELQPFGIGVTCVLPGATASTNFASSSSMEDALVWHYPWVVATADAVATRAVDGMVRGNLEVYPGRFLDRVFSKIVMPLAPPWLVTWFFGVSWSSSAWLHHFFRVGWTKSNNVSEHILKEQRPTEL
jgi:short-subunit dehydrogenase